MTSDELMALTRRLLDQLEISYLSSEDGSEVALDTEDGQPLFVQVFEIEYADGSTWPVLLSYTSVVEDVVPDAIDHAAIGRFNADLVVGKLSLQDASGASHLIVEHECVGWPGAAELRVTWGQILGHAGWLRDELLEATGGSMPAAFEGLGE